MTLNPSEKALDLLQQAEDFFDQGDFKGAIDFYYQAILLEPISLHFILAFEDSWKFEYFKLLDEALKKFPDHRGLEFAKLHWAEQITPPKVVVYRCNKLLEHLPINSLSRRNAIIIRFKYSLEAGMVESLHEDLHTLWNDAQHFAMKADLIRWLLASTSPALTEFFSEISKDATFSTELQLLFSTKANELQLLDKLLKAKTL